MLRGGWGSIFVVMACAVASMGCQLMGSLTNRKAMFAVNETASLGVVLRRANGAETTAREVDRLLTATSADADSAWLTKVALTASDATPLLAAAAERPPYLDQEVRVLAFEAWVKTLTEARGSDASPKVAAPTPSPAAPVTPPPAKGDKKKKGKPDKAQTPVAPPTTAVAAREVPVSNTVFGRIGPELVAAWKSLKEKAKEIEAIDAQITEVETAREAARSEEEKKAKKEEIKVLQGKRSAAKDEITPLEKAFLKAVKEGAEKAPAEVCANVAPAVFHLRRAVHDAKTANAAALLRYPLAMTGIVGDVKAEVRTIVADIVEEKTGKRPDMSKLSPGVTMDGLVPNVTINGLAAEDIGKLSVSEVVSETISRTKAFVARIAMLPKTLAVTAETLSLEEDVADAIVDGCGAVGWKAPDAPAIEPREPTKKKKE